MRIFKGTIEEFRGTWFSGIGFLIVRDPNGFRQYVPCENAQTVRSLEGAFGNVIGPGHSVIPDGGHIGQEIFYSLDEYGTILEAFTPVDQAPPELLRLYEAQPNKDRRVQ